jgi:hypothetical protein
MENCCQWRIQYVLTGSVAGHGCLTAADGTVWGEAFNGYVDAIDWMWRTKRGSNADKTQVHSSALRSSYRKSYQSASHIGCKS